MGPPGIEPGSRPRQLEGYFSYLFFQILKKFLSFSTNKVDIKPIPKIVAQNPIIATTSLKR